MTGLMHEKELSRKSFLKGGGALIVGFSVAGVSLAGRASATGITPYAGNSYATIDRDFSQVDSYLTVHADNTVSVTSGASDVGAGTPTGLLMIAADELGMDLGQLRFVAPDTGVTIPAQQGTNTSFATKGIGPQIRAAAAYGRQTLLELASSRLGVPETSLSVSKGVVSGGGKSVTYGDLLGDKLFNVKMPIHGIFSGSYHGLAAPDGSPTPSAPSFFAPFLDAGEAPAVPVSQYKLVGKRIPRFDIPDKMTGTFTYIVDVRLPGMFHGRVVLPKGQGGYGSAAKPLSVDESSIKHIADVQVVRRGDFVGVVAPREYDAIQAASQLKVTWAEPPPISGSGNLWKKMRDDVAAGLARADRGSIGAEYGGKFGPVGDVDAALKSAAHVVSASYGYAYQIHAPIGPMCAVADVTPSGARVYTYAQGLQGMNTAIAGYLDLPPSRVRVTEYQGASYHGGGRGGVQPAVAAAVMSQIVGKPVRVQSMRWDEHGWDKFGAMFLFDLRGGIDANGNIVAYERTDYSPVQGGNVIFEQQLGKADSPNLGQTPGKIDAMTPEVTANGVQYEIPNWRVTWKALPLWNNYYPTGAMRASQSSQTTFSTEVFFDELAYAAKMDPVAFRRQNIRKTELDAVGPHLGEPGPVNGAYRFRERFLAVLNAVAQASNWQPRIAASNLSDANIVTGRGVSFGPRTWEATISAVVAEIEVNKKTGKILVKHLYAAQDNGMTINPASVENTITGQVVFNTSRALHEEVRFNTKRQTSLDWVSYPILRFKDAPNVTPIIVNRPELRPAGAGDHVMEHVPAAIANAFFDATGVRIRQVPMTPARVRAALAAKGEGTLGVV
jgi:nicotinate dehydrogenase subunit B